MTNTNTYSDRPGFRKCPAMVTLTSATATDIFQPPGSKAGGNTVQIATQTAIIRKVMCYNGEATDIKLQFGTDTGGGFTAALPTLYVVAGQDAEWTEDQLPCYDFQNTIQVKATTASVGVTVLIEVEVLEAGTAPI